MDIGLTRTASVFFVEPQIKAPLDQAVSAYPLVLAQQLGPNIGALATTAPTVAFQPINYTVVNLRPFDIQV